MPEWRHTTFEVAHAGTAADMRRNRPASSERRFHGACWKRADLVHASEGFPTFSYFSYIECGPPSGKVAIWRNLKLDKCRSWAMGHHQKRGPQAPVGNPCDYSKCSSIALTYQVPSYRTVGLISDGK